MEPGGDVGLAARTEGDHLIEGVTQPLERRGEAVEVEEVLAGFEVGQTSLQLVDGDVPGQPLPIVGRLAQRPDAAQLIAQQVRHRLLTRKAEVVPPVVMPRNPQVGGQSRDGGNRLVHQPAAQRVYIFTHRASPGRGDPSGYAAERRWRLDSRSKGTQQGVGAEDDVVVGGAGQGG